MSHSCTTSLNSVEHLLHILIMSGMSLCQYACPVRAVSCTLLKSEIIGLPHSIHLGNLSKFLTTGWATGSAAVCLTLTYVFSANKDCFCWLFLFFEPGGLPLGITFTPLHRNYMCNQIGNQLILRYISELDPTQKPKDINQLLTCIKTTRIFYRPILSSFPTKSFFKIFR